MKPVRVLIVDDHLKYRMALLAALAQDPTLEIVEEASDGYEAVEKAKAVRPDVVLMDLHMPECNGDEATRRLQAEVPGTNVVINTISDQESDLVNALRCGARGYLLKSEDPEMMVQAIQYVARGGIMVSPSMANKLLTEVQGALVEDASANVGPLMNHPVHSAPVTTDPMPSEPVPSGPAATQSMPNGHEPERARSEAAETLATMSLLNPERQKDGDSPTFATAVAEDEEQLEDITPMELDTRVLDAELVIGPPLEPPMVLRLHQWLTESAEGTVEKVVPSLSGDTVLIVHLSEAIPLWRLMSQLPFVSEMHSDPSGESAEAMTKRERSRRRFRVTLKAL